MHCWQAYCGCTSGSKINQPLELSGLLSLLSGVAAAEELRNCLEGMVCQYKDEPSPGGFLEVAEPEPALSMAVSAPKKPVVGVWQDHTA